MDPWTHDDPLGEALQFMRMSGAFYGRSELTSPWGISLHPIAGYMWLHIVNTGQCRLEADGAEPRLLQPGDLALVPHGAGHVLRSEPGAPAPPILSLERELVSARYEILRHGGGGARTSMICAAVRFDHPAALNLIRLLPPAIHVHAAASPQMDWMQSTLRLMAAEADAVRPGSETVITRLADVLVVQAIRAWIEHDPAARTGWLGALQDPQIGQAIALIHREPARAWTVASLADELAMSRSAFAARFTALVDEPVMRYVTRWRMHLALSTLQDEGATVGELADRLGYRSEAAFSRAFKRMIGIAPGAVTRDMRSDAERVGEPAASWRPSARSTE